MLQRNLLLSVFLLLISMVPVSVSGNHLIMIANDTLGKAITQDEKILFNMINDMRLQNQLMAIPLSADLCKVARTHIADLIKYKPQEKGCSLHSWSGGGKWTSCCNTKEVFGIQCMKSKPREITGYKGDGYELIYWGEDKASPADAVNLWKQVDASTDMILSRNKWNGYEWKALGVGIRDGYAILWLGDSISANANLPVYSETDTPVTKPVTSAKATAAEKEVSKPAPVAITKESPIKPQATKAAEKATSGKFYIIVGSFTTSEAANKEMQSIKAKGFSSLYILEGDALYRIVLASFDTKEKADIRKNELKDTFPGVWVYKK